MNSLFDILFLFHTKLQFTDTTEGKYKFIVILTQNSMSSGPLE